MFEPNAIDAFLQNGSFSDASKQNQFIDRIKNAGNPIEFNISPPAPIDLSVLPNGGAQGLDNTSANNTPSDIKMGGSGMLGAGKGVDEGTNTDESPADAKPSEAGKKNNTILYVGIVAIVIVVSVIAWAFSSKTKV